MSEAQSNRISEPGRYTGFPMDKSFDKDKNGYIYFVCLIACDGVLVDGSLQPMEPRKTVVARIMLKGKNGVNQKQLEAIQGAFNWDGKSVKALLDANHSATRVNAVVEIDTDAQGNTRFNQQTGEAYLRVAWINRPGGLKKNVEVIDSIDSEWTAIMAGNPPSRPAAVAAPAQTKY